MLCCTHTCYIKVMYPVGNHKAFNNNGMDAPICEKNQLTV